MMITSANVVHIVKSLYPRVKLHRNKITLIHAYKALRLNTFEKLRLGPDHPQILIPAPVMRSPAVRSTTCTSPPSTA